MVDTRNIRRGRFTGRCRICNRRTRGPDANRWQGGRGLTSHGYVWIRTADGASEYEHRIVAEGMIGRPLEPWEHVHHRNGDKADNRPENLVVLNAEVHQIITELEAEVVRLRRRVKELEG